MDVEVNRLNTHTYDYIVYMYRFDYLITLQSTFSIYIGVIQSKPFLCTICGSTRGKGPSGGIFSFGFGHQGPSEWQNSERYAQK